MGGVAAIVKKIHLPAPDLNIMCMSNVEGSLRSLPRKEWFEEAETKPKLCSYKEFRDTEEPGTLAHSNLKINERSMLAKLMLRILPLEIEKAHHKDKKKNKKVKKTDHLCKVCHSGAVEDEYHFLFSCDPLKVSKMLFT